MDQFLYRQLVRYADSVTAERPLPLPEVGSSELRKLAQALESMRVKLEGKNAIENYVYDLTHELKSPLAAIRGAAEILREGPRLRWRRGLLIISSRKTPGCNCWWSGCSSRRDWKAGWR